MTVTVVHVVVPAHNEEVRVSRCLLAIDRAAGALRHERPELVVHATLVLDRCTDGTASEVAELVPESLSLHIVEIDTGCVGVARHEGVSHVAKTSAHVRADNVWVATTDADSVVSESWLVDHVRLAARHDLIVGAVTPEPTELAPRTHEEWVRRHSSGGLHIHGANLGFRLAAYRGVGGFPPVHEHEDVLLVQAMQDAGTSWARGSHVITSARHGGRTPGGFARYVALLHAQIHG